MSMRRPRYNLGRADWIGVEAIGVPGQRTFRLLLAANGQSAHLWLEKEQLQALTEAIARMLAEIGEDQELDILSRPQVTTTPKPADFPSTPDIELYIGALGLRYDPQQEQVALEAFDRNEEDTETPALRCIASREQMESLRQSATEVIAAGRPRCPLCGTPLSAPGVPHFCPPTNGHQKIGPEGE